MPILKLESACASLLSLAEKNVADAECLTRGGTFILVVFLLRADGLELEATHQCLCGYREPFPNSRQPCSNNLPCEVVRQYRRNGTSHGKMCSLDCPSSCPSLAVRSHRHSHALERH